MAGFAYADMPDRAVVTADTLRLGGEDDRDLAPVARPGGAHTAGDLIVWLPNERVLSPAICSSRTA